MAAAENALDKLVSVEDVQALTTAINAFREQGKQHPLPEDEVIACAIRFGTIEGNEWDWRERRA
jgi:hypothetical protein